MKTKTELMQELRITKTNELLDDIEKYIKQAMENGHTNLSYAIDNDKYKNVPLSKIQRTLIECGFHNELLKDPELHIYIWWDYD